MGARALGGGERGYMYISKTYIWLMRYWGEGVGSMGRRHGSMWRRYKEWGGGVGSMGRRHGSMGRRCREYGEEA